MFQAVKRYENHSSASKNEKVIANSRHQVFNPEDRERNYKGILNLGLFFPSYNPESFKQIENF